MFWMLREEGASYAEIGRAADLSGARVRQICRAYGYQLHRRSEYTSEEPFMARPRRAGSLLGVAERVEWLHRQRQHPRRVALRSARVHKPVVTGRLANDSWTSRTICRVCLA